MNMSGQRDKDNDIWRTATSSNTAYTLWADAFALQDIALFGRNVVYAGKLYEIYFSPLFKGTFI
jgi:hypothetical protein